MKVKRLKKVNKRLGFFITYFGFRKPFQVLIDGTFFQQALQVKVNIKEQLPKFLDGDAKLLTTVCTIKELEALGPVTHGAMLIAKQFPVHRCGHEHRPRQASNCIRSMIKDNNSCRYIIATQDADLRERARATVGTPVLYLHHNAPTMERPSEVNQEYIQKMSCDTTDQQLTTVKMLKQKEGLQEEVSVKRLKKKRKGGPNPLSCKKKRGIPVPQSMSSSPKRARRKRKKLPKHIKEHLASL